MKINVELEIPGMTQEGTLEEAIRDAVIDSVKKRVVKKIVEEATPKIEERLSNVADDAINTLLAKFLSDKVTISDQWGRSVKKDISIEDLLREKFDNFWTAKVDREGRAVDGGYSSYGTRMQWLLDQRVAELCKKFSDDLAKKVEEQVKSIITDKLKASIGGTLIDSIGVPEIMKRLEAPAKGR